MSNYFKHKMRTKKPMEIVGWVLLAIIGITALAILFGFIIMWLWNWLMPELFDLGTITYWQGVGIFILSKILLGGFGGGGGKSGHKSHHKKHKHDKNDCGDSGKNEISKWKHYDKFWEEEGNQAFEKFLDQKTSGSSEEE